MNENIHMLFHFYCQTYCVNISPAEEKDLCNYGFVPLLPFPTLLQRPEKDGAVAKMMVIIMMMITMILNIVTMATKS